MESCLPKDELVVWKRSRNKTDADVQDERTFINLMNFLKIEVMTEERVVLAPTGFVAHYNKKDI